jgi:hypothetical protein
MMFKMRSKKALNYKEMREVKPRSDTTQERKTSSDKKVVVIVFVAVAALLICTAGV